MPLVKADARGNREARAKIRLVHLLYRPSPHLPRQIVLGCCSFDALQLLHSSRSQSSHYHHAHSMTDRFQACGARRCKRESRNATRDRGEVSRPVIPALPRPTFDFSPVQQLVLIQDLLFAVSSLILLPSQLSIIHPQWQLNVYRRLYLS